MRFEAADLASLKEAVQSKLNSINMTAAELRAREYADKTERRFLWDLFHASEWSDNNREASNKYFDTHIETAMKAVVRQIKEGRDAV